ncbi:MAG: response regulator [Burkholderiaceae bacterium]|nr:response regulator [Burkholderiaceae bacterium]
MLDPAEILNASILIVDDQPANVLLLERMLRDAGYRNCSSTMDPKAVCGLHLRHRYDLILLDLQMPEMDGFEVMEALTGIETGGYLPVLVITAQPGHKLRALQAGAKDFVSKPFELVEVQTRIRNMLEVRLLYRQLALHNLLLEQKVLERTAALRDSEARFKSLAELSSDWYWEQDAAGAFTKTSGPVFEMLGMETPTDVSLDQPAPRWNSDERAQLDANIAARRPFLDHVYSRTLANGTVQYLQVSGEPMFDAGSAFIGYRGVGSDISARVKLDAAQTPPSV